MKVPVSAPTALVSGVLREAPQLCPQGFTILHHTNLIHHPLRYALSSLASLDPHHIAVAEAWSKAGTFSKISLPPLPPAFPEAPEALPSLALEALPDLLSDS